MINLDFSDESNIAIFPSANEILKLPSDIDLVGSTTIRISGSDFIMEFANGKSLTLLFGGIFTSVGNTLTIQDSRGTNLDLNELMSSYEVLVSDNVILQPIDAIALNQLLEKIPDGEGQEIASGAAETGEGGIAQGSAEEGEDGKQQGKEGKSKNEQEELEFKLTSDKETDDEVEKVTGSGSSEAGGEDDLSEANVNQYDSREDKTQDFAETIQQLTSTDDFTSTDDGPAEDVSTARARSAGSVSDSDALVQTSLVLALSTDSGSNIINDNDTLEDLSDDTITGDSLTNASILRIEGLSTDGAAINLYLENEFNAGLDPLTGLSTATPINGAIAIDVPTDPLVPGQWFIDVNLSDISTASLAVNTDGEINGTLTLVAQPTAANGTVGINSAPLLITIDQTIEAPTVELSSDFVSPIDASFTNDPAFEINGTAEANSTIQIFVNGSTTPLNTPTITTNANGDWSFAVGSLVQSGANAIVVRSIDLAGNDAVSAEVTINLDLTAPSTPQILAVTASDDGLSGTGFVGDNTPIIQGSGTVGSFIVVTIDGEAGNSEVGITLPRFEITEADGSWSFESPVSLSEGLHSFTAVAIDRANNASQPSTELQVVVANPSTQLSIELAEASESGVVGDNVTNMNENIALSGTGAIGETLSIMSGTGESAVELGTVVVDTNSIWTFATTGSQVDSLQTFSVVRTATSQTESVNVLVDTQLANPTVSFSVGNVVGETVFISVDSSGLTGTLSVQTEAFTEVVVVANAAAVSTRATADNNGVATIDLSALNLNVGTEADNMLAFTITDVAGNTASLQTQVTINPPLVLAPSLSLSPSDITGVNTSLTRNTDVTLIGNTTADTDVRIMQQVGAEAVLVATVRSNELGVFSTGLTGFANGESVTFTAEAVNLAGQVSRGTPLSFTIDTTASNPPNLELDINFDSGLVGDGITNPVIVNPTNNPNQVVINGSGSGAGDIATIFVNDAQVVFADNIIANDSGLWTATLTLTEGVNNITAFTTDGAGNESALSDVLGITLDTQIEAPTININSANQGLVDGFSNERLLTLEGQSTSGSEVTIMITNSSNVLLPALTATANENGSWTVQYPLPGLGDDSYSAVATTVDAAGNSASSGTLTFVIDTNPPAAPTMLAVVGIDPSNGGTNDLTPEISGMVAEGGIFVEIININTGSVLGQVQSNSDGGFIFQVPDPLSLGDQNLQAVAIDEAGNRSDVSTTLNFDIRGSNTASLTIGLAQDPNPLITSDTGRFSDDNITNRTNVVLEGTANPNQAVRIFLGDAGTITSTSTPLGAAVADSTGTWRFDNDALGVTLAEGTQVLSVISGLLFPGDTGFTQDNIASQSIQLDLLLASPAVTIEGAQLNSGTFFVPDLATGIIRVATEAFSSVSVTVGSSVVTGVTDVNGIFSTPIASLPTIIPSSANQQITTSVTDLAGNTAGSVTNLIVDTIDPEVDNIQLSTDDQTGSVATFTSNGNFIIEGSIVNERRDELVNVEVTFTISNIVDGDGNTQTLPAVSSASVSTTGINSFTAAVPVTLLPALGVAGQSATVIVSAVATDLAGNSSAPNVENITVDNIPPSIPTISLEPEQDSNGAGAVGDGVTFHGGGDSSVVAGGSRELAILFNRDVGSDLELTIVDSTGVTLPLILEPASTGATTTAGITIPVLDDGSYTITAVAIDEAGNRSTPSSQLNIVIDTEVAASTLALAADNQGIANATTPETITNDVNFVIQGTAEVGADVMLQYVSAGNTFTASTTVATDGSWSIAASSASGDGDARISADGIYNITATITDIAGNIDSTASINITLDQTAPTAATIIDTGANVAGFIADNTPTITGSADQGDFVAILLDALIDHDSDAATTALPLTNTLTSTALFNGDIDVNTILAQATEIISVGEDASWTFTPPGVLDDGEHTIAAITIDSAGNYTFTNTDQNIETFTVDLLAPTTTLDIVQGAAITIGGATNSEMEAELETNLNTLNLAGVVTGTEGESGFQIRFEIDGVQVGGNISVTDTDGSWTTSIDISGRADGIYNLTAIAVDQAGNSTEANDQESITIIRDTVVEPAVTVELVQNTIPNTGTMTEQSILDALSSTLASNISSNTPTFSGVIEGEFGDLIDSIVITDRNDGNAVVEEFSAANIATQQRLSADGRWTLTPSALVDGDYNITITDTDAAGNPSSATLDFTIDSVGEANPNFSLATTQTLFNTTRPEFTGMADADTFVILRLGAGDDSPILGTTQVDSTGNWTVTPNLIALVDGSTNNDLVFENRDAAGNVLATTETLNDVEIDARQITDSAGIVNLTTTQVAGVDINDIDQTNSTGTLTLDGVFTLAGGLPINTNIIVTLALPGEPGNQVTIGSDDLTAIGGNQFTWSTPVPASVASVDSIVTVQIRLENSFGAQGPGTTYQFEIDRTNPAQPNFQVPMLIDTVADTDTNPDVFQITGNVTPALAGSSIAIQFTQDGGVTFTSLQQTTTVASDGSWQITAFGLADGDYQFQAVATDEAGNVSNPTALSAIQTLDTQVVFAVNQSSLSSNSVTPIITGTVESDAASIVVGSSAFSGNVNATINAADGTWSANFGTNAFPANANSTLTFTVTDAAGNVATMMETLEVDTIAPTPPSLTSINSFNFTGTIQGATGESVNNLGTGEVTINGVAEVGSTVQLFIGSNTASFPTAETTANTATGEWSITIGSAPATSDTLTVRSIDSAGNMSGDTTANISRGATRPLPESLFVSDSVDQPREDSDDIQIVEIAPPDSVQPMVENDAPDVAM